MDAGVSLAERALLGLSGLLLLHAGGWSDAVGLTLSGVVGILHYLRHSGRTRRTLAI